MSDDPTLDAELAELLERGRSEALPPGAREAVRAGVRRRLMRPFVYAGVISALAAGGIALFAGFGGSEPVEPPAPPVEAPAEAPEPEPRAEPEAPVLPAPAPPVEAPVEEPEEFVAIEEAPPRARRRREPAPPEEPPEEPPAPAVSTLQQEVALMQRAHAALERGDPRAALGALDEHASRFEDGVLRLDREATRWVARCELEPSARAGGRAFAERHPRHPQAARLRRACAGSEIP